MRDDARSRPGGWDRRAFLVASGAGLAGLGLGPIAEASRAVGFGDIASRADSTILFFLCGGASHVDTWDLKPDAPAEYRGPFRPIATSATGLRLCEHLPMVAQQAHHLAVVNSVGASVNTNDHHAGYYYNLTGHIPDESFRTLANDRTPRTDDWPYMGCVAASRRPPHPHLPNAITLPHRPSKAPYTRPGQFAARLGIEHDPLYVHGDLGQPLRFQAPALTLVGEITAQRLQDRRSLLAAVYGRGGTSIGARGATPGRASSNAPGACWPRLGRPRHSTSPPSRQASGSVTVRPSTA